MSYKITIERTQTVKKTVGKQWKLCGTAENSQYDYTPEVETLREETEKIYEQTVDELNLIAVISAVNPMPLVKYTGSL
jgi:hypothetical protein